MKSLDQALQIEESLVEVNKDGTTVIVIVNNSSSSCKLNKGSHVSEAEVLHCAQQEPVLTQLLLPTANGLSADGEESQQLSDKLNVFSVSAPVSSERMKWRQQQLGNLLRSTREQLSEEHYLPLEELLSEYHDVFSLEEDERGETDMVEFEINTGDELPRKQAARRIPYTAHQEVAEQLEKMQKTSVIRPSSSP